MKRENFISWATVFKQINIPNPREELERAFKEEQTRLERIMNQFERDPDGKNVPPGWLN
jgi:hypothetical protein